MSIKKMKKEEIELLSNKEITYLLLEDSKKSMTTAQLYKKIIELKELPESYFESKIGDYYMALSTDKNLVMLEDGTWDLRSRHTSDKVVKASEEDDDIEIDDEIVKDDQEEEIVEDSFDDSDENDYDDSDEDLKDLVVIDEDEMEIE